mgnify:CR=1 FL=1
MIVADRKILVEGAEVWCIMTKPIGRRGKRLLLVGAAFAEVVGFTDIAVRVRVVRGGDALVEGHEHVVPRALVYSAAVPAENNAFGAHFASLRGER